MTQRPSVLGLILCQHAWLDPHQGKCHLLGTVSVSYLSSIPRGARALWAFASTTDGMGTGRLRMDLVDPTDGPLAEADQLVEWANPLDVVERLADFSHVVYHSEGIHRVRLWIDDELMTERRLRIVLRRGKSDHAEDQGGSPRAEPG